MIPVWSDTLGRELAIDTVPDVWMDRALSKYHGVEDPRGRPIPTAHG